jgi:hypothetical protein
VEIHPAVIILLLVVAGQLFGVLGMIIAVPLAAVLRDTFVYIYRRLDDETIAGAVMGVEAGQRPEERAEVLADAIGPMVPRDSSGLVERPGRGGPDT